MKNRKRTEWPQNDLERKKVKGTPYMLNNYPHRESKISLRFAVKSLVFQIIEVFDFSIGYNGEFAIFENKISKIPNVLFWGPLAEKFRTGFKTFGCNL